MDQIRIVRWIGSSRRDLKAMPAEVRLDVGKALMEAQGGGKSDLAKPLKGFGGAGILEVVSLHDGDSFRAIYTVRFAEAVYVLHCFQKKSKSGIATPQQELNMIRTRLRAAQNAHTEWKKNQDSK